MMGVELKHVHWANKQSNISLMVTKTFKIPKATNFIFYFRTQLSNFESYMKRNIWTRITSSLKVKNWEQAFYRSRPRV